MSDIAFEVAPERLTELIQEIGKEQIEQRKRALKAVHSRGYLIFSPDAGPKQLDMYLKSTLEGEFQMFLDPNYLDLVEQGVYPPPQSPVYHVIDKQGAKASGVFATEQEALVAAYRMGLLTPQMIEAHNAVAQGLVDPMMQPPPPLPVAPFPSFWGQVYACGRYDDWSPFEAEINDFKKLLRTYERKLQGRVAM